MTEQQQEIIQTLVGARGADYAGVVSVVYSLILKDAIALRLYEELGKREADEVLDCDGALGEILGNQTYHAAVVLANAVDAKVDDLIRDARVLVAKGRTVRERR